MFSAEIPRSQEDACDDDRPTPQGHVLRYTQGGVDGVEKGHGETGVKYDRIRVPKESKTVP